MQPFLRLSNRRTLPIVRQVESAECGLACIAMISAFHGYEVSLQTLRRRFSVSLRGTNLKNLISVASGVGLGARAVRCELEELKDLRLPAILHWGLRHFVVLKRIRGERAEIHDPANGIKTVRFTELSASFTGIALELWPNETFETKREKVSFPLRRLVRLSPQVGKALIQAVLLSAIIELFAIVGPFYLQIVIDRAISSVDRNLLAVLASAFGAVLIFNVLAKVLRGLTIQFVSKVISFDMQARIFHHLIRLPLDWFQKRNIGDIQNRFSSLQPIQQFISMGTISAAFDGILGLFIFGFMLYYSVLLTMIVTVAIGLYAVIRLVTLPLSQENSNNWLVAASNEQSRFLETVRAAQTVKAAGAEPLREGVQLNAMATAINAGIRQGNFNIAYSAASLAISGLADIVLVFFGALSVMNSTLSLGMLIAFLAYKAQFVERCTQFVEQVIAWQLLRVPLERLADILLEPTEDDHETDGIARELSGAIECCQLSFRYAQCDPDVIERLDLRVEPGEFIAITGPSGCGKSTLLKLLVGLYRPTAGSVLLDGWPISAWNLRLLRSQIAFVSQDDQLLSGTIAENIAFFEDEVDIERVQECARLASVHGEIARMPMGYNTFVGDMGSALSGGQKQRVVIARSLYRRPRILILDEATSHLDIENERAINDALGALSITRVVVAHRAETLRLADRVIRLGPRSADAANGESRKNLMRETEEAAVRRATVDASQR